MKKLFFGYTTSDTHRSLLEHLKAMHGLRGDRVMDVLHWLCTKGDRTGEVVLNAQDYRDDLNMTSQQFHNHLTQLKRTGLVTGSNGIYQLSRDIIITPTDAIEVTFMIVQKDNNGIAK